MYIIRFVWALIRWVLCGFSMRSKNEIAYIYQCMCLKCPHIILKSSPKTLNVTSECDICGCLLSPKKVILNKIAWASEECPDNPPRWRSKKLRGFLEKLFRSNEH
jgi:hypothetical protein